MKVVMDMLWKVNKFEISSGDNVKVWGNPRFPCVYQIKCQSSKINDSYEEGQSCHSCYINFVEGNPPNSVCFPLETYPEPPIPNDIPGDVCSFSLKLDQFDYFFSILTNTEVYLDINENQQKLNKIIAKSIDTSPIKVIASDPVNEEFVNRDKVVKIIFGKDIEPGREYGDISLTYKDRNNNTVITTITKSIERNRLTIQQSSGSLAQGTTYTLSVPVDSIQDLSENSLNKDYILKFTTYFRKPPR